MYANYPLQQARHEKRGQSDFFKLIHSAPFFHITIPQEMIRQLGWKKRKKKSFDWKATKSSFLTGKGEVGSRA